MPTTRRLPALLLAVALLASCDMSVPTRTADETRVRSTGSGKGKVATKASPGASTAPGASAAPGEDGGGTPAKTTYFGRVVAIDGRSAAFVAVRAYKVEDAAGAGVLTAAKVAPAAFRLAQAEAPLTTKTKADGSFVFDVPAGTKLVVEAEQAKDVKAIGTMVAKPDAGVELRLAKTGTVQGKVTASGAPGVKDLAGAEVSIAGIPYAVKVDAAGTFKLENVPVGDFQVRATRADLGDGTFGPVAVASGQTAQITVDIGVITPKITALEPAVAGPGASVRAKGTGFANTRGTAFTLTLAGVPVESPARTDDGTITFVVPATAVNGDVVITVGAVASAPAKLQVIKSLSIQANPKELATGATHTFTATAVDSAGAAVATVPAIWTASGAAFADAAGVITAGTSAGDATVEATSGSLKDTLVVKVIPAPASAAPSAAASTTP